MTAWPSPKAAFLVPFMAVMALFFYKNEKVRKYFKYWLFLWVPVLVNLALVGELFEIDENVGGIAGKILANVREQGVDFIFVFIGVIGMDLVILHLMGVSIRGLIRELVALVKRVAGEKEQEKE